VPSDLDAFQFYGQSGDQVQIDAAKTSGTTSFQPRLYLYPPGGGAYEKESGALTYIHNYVLQNSGLYTIVVQDFSAGLNATNTGRYTISVSKTGGTRPGIYNPFPANGATLTVMNGTLRCDAVADATGYDLYFGEGVTQALAKIGDNLAAPSLAFPAMSRGKTYYWQVVAHTASGDIKGPQSWFQVSTKSPGVPCVPLLLD
jgi:hypothetical protein